MHAYLSVMVNLQLCTSIEMLLAVADSATHIETGTHLLELLHALNCDMLTFVTCTLIATQV